MPSGTSVFYAILNAVAPRKVDMNFFSTAVIHVMNIITALLHFVLPKDAEALASAAMIGSLFTIWALPGGLVYGLCRWLGVAYLLPYVGAMYLAVIWLDPQHLKAPSDKPAHSKFRKLNALESASLAFWTSHFDYFPLTCVFGKGAKDAIDPNRQYVFAVHPHGIHCWPFNVFAFVV